MYTEKQFDVPNIYHSAALETASLVTTGVAKLLGLLASNASGQAGFIQVFDSATVPSTNTVPMVSIYVASASQTSLDCGVFSCLPVRKGIVIALSSTEAVYTPVTNNSFVTAAWL